MSYEDNKKWRKKHPDVWAKMKKRYYRQFEIDAYNGKQIWTISDGNLILQKKIVDRDLARILGRTVKAIQTQRYRLKKFFKNKKNLL